MRTTLSILVVALMVSFSVSCRKENLYKTFDKSESWRITSFNNYGDKTSEFSGYTFTFKKKNVLEVKKGSTTISGTWSQNTYKEMEDLVISLPESDTILNQLNEQWGVDPLSSDAISLTQHSPNREKSVILEH